MSLAKNAINEIMEICERAKENNEILVYELSRNDLATQDILHYIEFEEITPMLGFSAAKKLKDLRVIRRQIKDELEPLQTLISMLDNQKLDKIQQRIDLKVNQQNDRHYIPKIIKGGLAKAVNG